jgi:hypothetical protein
LGEAETEQEDLLIGPGSLRFKPRYVKQTPAQLFRRRPRGGMIVSLRYLLLQSLAPYMHRSSTRSSLIRAYFGRSDRSRLILRQSIFKCTRYRPKVERDTHSFPGAPHDPVQRSGRSRYGFDGYGIAIEPDLFGPLID